jgi:hypothetical protein
VVRYLSITPLFPPYKQSCACRGEGKKKNVVSEGGCVVELLKRRRVGRLHNGIVAHNFASACGQPDDVSARRLAADFAARPKTSISTASAEGASKIFA